MTDGDISVRVPEALTPHQESVFDFHNAGTIPVILIDHCSKGT
jgi:hypothetical protein